MSADNGIYIHKFRNGWRVAHAQAIENIYWKRGSRPYNYRILKNYFKHSPLFETKAKALEYAGKLYDEYGYLEYGISFV